MTVKTPDASALTTLRKAEILDPIIAGDSTITGKADNAGKDGKAGKDGNGGNGVIGQIVLLGVSPRCCCMGWCGVVRSMRWRLPISG